MVAVMHFSDDPGCNGAFLVDQIERRPVLVPQGAPVSIIVIHKNRVVELVPRHGRFDPASNFLVVELGRVNPDDLKSFGTVFAL